MPIDSLRGDTAKQNLIRNYSVTPIVYVRLLSTQGERRNSCGGTLTHHYYQFEAVRNGSNEKETFYVGDDCGRQILNLLNIPHSHVRLFDPIDANIAGGGNHGGGNNVNAGHHVAMHPLARELFEAINLIFMYHDNEPFGMFAKMLEDIRKYPTSAPFTSKFKSVNTYLRNKGLSMQSMLTQLQHNNHGFRNFTFEGIRNALLTDGVADADIVLG